MKLINGDCLEEMKKLEKNSIDLLFCDLPYGQTSCKWDCLIDLDLFWKEVNRICKDTTPMFFTCSTKFGVSLINSNPKNFRYDLVWVKSAPCGFLNAKKMPMKKHEMVYVFYKKLPLYDLSSHTHKFLKEDISIVKRKEEESMYGTEKNKIFIYDEKGKLRNSEPRYEPPLPNSVIKEDNIKTDLYSSKNKIEKRELYRNEGGQYEPPLPNSVIKEEYCKYDVNKNTYGGGEEGRIKISKDKREHETRYEPPLPNSILDIKSEKGKHATQKPLGLTEWILKYYSKSGDKVLDPTMGSGTMGISCKKMGREFIGIELDEKIFKVAEERLKID